MTFVSLFRRSFVAFALVLAVFGQVGVQSARADEVKVAVAANFTLPMKQKIIPAFEAATKHTVVATYGPTGGLYNQIKAGAPIDVMLSADTERPAKLASDGMGVAASKFTFAVGKVVLWSATPGLVDAEGKVLSSGKFAHIALANPKIAPYGLAAQQALQKLNVWTALEPKVVYGQDLNQTYQMISTKNAELGFVALSQLKADWPEDKYWSPPQDLYTPIDQDAILLTKSKDNKAAVDFLAFLKSPAARKMIEDFGYGVK